MSDSTIYDDKYNQVLEALTRLTGQLEDNYDGKPDISRRNQRVSDIDGRIARLTEQLMIKLRNERNSYIPINRLVDDVLLYIWSYIDLSDRFAISKVCSRWRQLALSTSSLWGIIDLHRCEIRCIRQLLSRSDSSALHMVVACKNISPKAQLALEGSYSYSYDQDLKPFKGYNLLSEERYRNYVSGPNKNIALDSDHLDFITQPEFDAMVGRCSTLDALVGEKPKCYVRPDSSALSTSMPYLRTLRLVKADKAQSTREFYDPTEGTYPDLESVITPDKLPFPLFNNDTPFLQELCFDYLNARWDDPIYRHLTNLRVYKPHTQVSISQILQILRACPSMTDLDLTDGLLPLSSKPSVPRSHPRSRHSIFKSREKLSKATETSDEGAVSLPKMKYLCFEERDDATAKEFLASLSLPKLKYLYLGHSSNMMTFPLPAEKPQPRFTDEHDCPLPSLISTIAETQRLRIDCNPHYIFLDARYLLNELDRARISDWTHLGNSSDQENRPDKNTKFDLGLKNEEIGRWSYILHPAAQHDRNDEVDVNDWTSVTYNIALEPTPGASPPFPTKYTHVAMNYTLIPTCRQYVNLLNGLSMGGAQLDKVHTLQIDGSAHCPDDFYRSIFRMCRGIRKLRMNYDKGVGILAAIVKDDMLPMLEEVYLDVQENHSRWGIVGETPPEVLAGWVEARQSKAFEPSTIPRGRLLKKLLVLFYYRNPVSLEPETGKRFVRALGETGEFVWQVKKSRSEEALQNCKKVLGMVGFQHPEDNVTHEECDYIGVDDVDKYIAGTNSRPIGWSAGPW